MAEYDSILAGQPLRIGDTVSFTSKLAFLAADGFKVRRLPRIRLLLLPEIRGSPLGKSRWPAGGHRGRLFAGRAILPEPCRAGAVRRGSGAAVGKSN